MRTVLFVDPPAFCTTVEQLVAPALRSRPLAVAPPGAERGTVLALSHEAELAGVRRGMATRLARKLCRDLVLVPPNPRLYARASRALDEVLRVYAPVIEPRWYGHAFLDISGTERLFGPAVDVAERIRREVRERLRLPLWVGVAGNKLVSEAATRVGRVTDRRTDSSYRSDSQTVRPSDMWPIHVVQGMEQSFLAPHHIDILPDVPDRIRAQLDDYQLDMIGDIAAIDEADLYAVLGREGRILRARARGIDPRPVLPPEVRAEYRVMHTLSTDTNDLGVLHTLLRRLTELLGRRLRQRGLAARRLTVGVDYVDYESDARALPIREAALDVELWDASRRALVQAMARRLAVRQVTVTVDRLIEANLQLDFWEPAVPRGAVLQRALDSVKRRGPSDRLTVCPLPSVSPSVRQSVQARTIFPNGSFDSMA
jgi:DNA polymerase-4